MRTATRLSHMRSVVHVDVLVRRRPDVALVYSGRPR